MLVNSLLIIRIVLFMCMWIHTKNKQLKTNKMHRIARKM